MKLDQSFEVAAPFERVWRALIDVEHVAPCLPGAQVTGRNDDDSYAGTFTVKIGPTTASYAGKLQMEQLDEAAHSATMQAHGNDKRGQGGAQATIVSTLSPTAGGGTHVEVSTDYHITGRLARFGRGGMIEDISERLLREFAGRLQASLEGDGASSGGSGSTAPGSGVADASEAAPAAGAPAAPVPPGAPVPGEPAAAEAAPAPPQPTEPIQGVSLIGSILWQRARRNPAPVAILAALVLALLFARRARR